MNWRQRHEIRDAYDAVGCDPFNGIYPGVLMRLVITTVDQPNTVWGNKAWDIVSVPLPDGAECGIGVLIEDFVRYGGTRGRWPGTHLRVLDVPGEPPDSNLEDAEMEWDQRDTIGSKRKIVTKRAWQIDPARLTAAQRAEILASDGVAVDLGRAGRAAINRKINGQGLPPTISNDGATKIRQNETQSRRKGETLPAGRR